MLIIEYGSDEKPTWGAFIRVARNYFKHKHITLSTNIHVDWLWLSAQAGYKLWLYYRQSQFRTGSRHKRGKCCAQVIWQINRLIVQTIHVYMNKMPLSNSLLMRLNK